MQHHTSIWGTKSNLQEQPKTWRKSWDTEFSALVLTLTLSLVLQSDQASTGQRHAAPLARLHTDTRLKNKVCALQEHKNALWNPIFNTKCYNELWENLELQQETDKKAQLTWARGFFRGATAEDHRSPGALAAAVEGAHSSRSSGEKQTDPDHTAGKTKGVCEFTSSCMHLQGYLTKVNLLDPVIVDILSATGSHSEVTEQYQGVHSRQHYCKSTQAFPTPIFFSIWSHPCRRQNQTSPPGAFPTPLTTQDG